MPDANVGGAAQGNAKGRVVVVIQEIFGLSDWIRGVADQLAAEGFVALGPDLLAGRGANGGDLVVALDQQGDDAGDADAVTG